MSHKLSEFIDLRSIATIEISRSNGIPNQFCYGKSDEIANECQIHRVYQPSFDNDIISTPFSKGWICLWRWWTIAVDIAQFIFAGDVHLDNLGPTGIVGTIQLDTDWSS